MIHRWSTVTPSSGQIVSLSQSITNNARASATRHSQRTYSTLTRPHIRPPHQAAVSSRAVPSSAYTNLTRTSSSTNSIPTTAAASLTRSFTTSRRLNGLEEFFVNNTAGDVGNAWTPAQLRLKSFEDLQKLWFVLLKERNMLHTYKRQCKGLGEPMQGPERIAKVRESMKGIKIVMGERYREYKAATDANWVAQRAELQQRRSIVNLRHKARTGLPSHKRPAIGGVEHFRLTKSQRYRGLKPRKEGDQPPQGEFPEGMLQQQQGHGQTKEALFQGKIKKEKEYH